MTILKLMAVASLTLMLCAGPALAQADTVDMKKKLEEIKGKAPDTVMSKEEVAKVKKVESDKAAEPEVQNKKSGVRYQELVMGEGKECKTGMRVDCHYTLWLAADSAGTVKGKRLQSSKDKGQSYQCTIGQRLIAGWSDGMIGMKEGGTRRIFIPWELGYGAKGMPPMIPGKSNLIFEIDFIKAL